ncbi:DUF4192 family protein [Leucobacter massiliensis]|uniref:DUF4192 domain-containing protein n=1 Tax=Leucobacter massiliensis TaxID=1686285 RepID=A0A2S9QL40_9MICO|nr:DUF4192 family protein [Leucobacter massiliensis]PRI10308.1 hypothetical protein B4915_13045 [Leucobacter massiliensis]
MSNAHPPELRHRSRPSVTPAPHPAARLPAVRRTEPGTEAGSGRRTEPPPTIRCESSADFLAALPRLVGFTSPDSIFVVFFSGRRAEHAMRLDLPATEDPRDSAELLDFICDALHDLGPRWGADSAPAVVITSSLRFADHDGAPWRRFAGRLLRCLRREGFSPRELCCVAADGWISFLDPHAPAGGRPLSEIEQSPVAAEIRAFGDAPPPLAELGALPVADPARRTAVARALATVKPLPRPSGASPAWVSETAEVARELRDPERPLSAEATARLIRSAQQPERWLLLALAVLTRPEFPIELAREIGAARFARVPLDLDAEPGPAEEIDRDPARDGPQAGEGGGQRQPGTRARDGWSIRRILESASPGFTQFERLALVKRRLLLAVSECPEELRPALLALSAWAWWLGGTQSVAQRQAAAAIAPDPGGPLPRMVGRLVDAPLHSPRRRRAARAA